MLGIIGRTYRCGAEASCRTVCGTYTSVENILTTSITSVILLVVGFSIEFDKKLLSPCIRTIVLRILLQAVMIGGVLLAIHYIVGDHLLLNLAVISYMSAPATFSMQTFLKSEDGSSLCFHHQFSVLPGIHTGVCGHGICSLLMQKKKASDSIF